MLNIINSNRHVIADLAEECGIDWSKAIRVINFNGSKISRNIENHKKNKGNVAMWCNISTDKKGNQYPFITFNNEATKTSTVFNGWEYIEKDSTRTFNISPKKLVIPNISLEPTKEDILAKRSLETTINRFKNLPLENGTHPYLVRKFGKREDFNADPKLFLNDCLRIDEGNRLIWAFSNFDGEITGFQHISATAEFGTDHEPLDKKAVWGSVKKGSFLILGSTTRIDENGKVVDRLLEDGCIVCEGLATGLALYNAPKKRGSFSNGERLPVFVCIDAGNMIEVARQLSERGCQNIILAADNDCTPKIKKNRAGEITNPEREFKLNTGVYGAFVLAREIGATVIIPKNADGTSCDFADTYNHTKHEPKKASSMAFRLELVKHAPEKDLKKLSFGLAFDFAAECPRKFSVKSALEMLKSVFSARVFNSKGYQLDSAVKSIITRVYKTKKAEVRRLNKLTKNSQFIEHDLNGCTNPEIARHIMETGGGFWYDYRGLGVGKTNMLIDLNSMIPHDTVAYIVHRISLTKDACNRFKIDNYEDLDPRFFTQKMGVCINSTPKFNVHQRFRVLFIDEARQVLEHILSGAVENRQAVFDEFILAIQAADLVVVSDADLNDKTVAFFQKHGGNKSHNLIKVDPLANDKTLHLIHDHQALMNNMLKCLQADKNIFVASTSIKKTTETAAFFVEQGVPEDLILVVNSENKADEKQAAFLANPNAECLKYKTVIHSPTIGSGVSITTPHFDYNFLINCGNLPANEALQMTARNRIAKDVFVSFSEQCNSDRVTDVDLLIEGEGLKTARYMERNSNGTFSPSELGNLRIDLYSRSNADMNDFANNFILLAEINGMTINYDRANEEIYWLEAEKLKGLSGRVKEKTVDTIFASEVITESEAEALGEKNALTQAETNKLKRHMTTKMVGLETIEREDVKNFESGMMKVLGLYEIFESEPAELMMWDKANYTTKDKRYSKTSLNRLLVDLFDVAASDGLIVSQKTAGKFCNALKKNAAELAANGMGNYNKTMFKCPMKTMKSFMKRFGFELENHGRETKGDRKEIFLLKENETIRRYASNRAALKATQSVTIE